MPLILIDVNMVLMGMNIAFPIKRFTYTAFRLVNITEFAEKPTLDYARTSLRVPGLPENEYLTVFGQYIIKPQIFDYLEEHVRNNVRERGEFQLTSALDRLRQEEGFLGLIIDGQRYDIGLPEYYLETLQGFPRD